MARGHGRTWRERRAWGVRMRSCGEAQDWPMGDWIGTLQVSAACDATPIGIEKTVEHGGGVMAECADTRRRCDG